MHRAVASTLHGSGMSRVGQRIEGARETMGWWVLRGLSSMTEMHGTTILTVRRGGKAVVIGDGQISQGNTVVKGNAVKVRRLGGNLNESVVLAGFAGATADALTLLDRLEKKLEQYPGQLSRACVELAKLWRTDKYLRRLEALMIVVDKDVSLTLTGNGDVIQSNDGIIAIGSGGMYALSAARALVSLETPELTAEDIARKSMKIASDLCVFTNDSYILESIDIDDDQEKKKKT